MEVTKRFAEFVVQTRLEDVPSEERRLASLLMLDSLGVMLAAVSEPAGRLITDYVRDLGGKEEASVVGGGFKTNAANAALANGTLGHTLDFDDVGGFGHPTVVLLPAILAVGEKLGKTGRDAVEAYCVGFEVGLSLLRCNARMEGGSLIRGFHSTAVIGHFAATAALARLMGLDVEQTQRAFGIAASSSAGVCANFGYFTKPLHAGQACRNAVIAAELSARGWTASPEAIEHRVGWAESFFGLENFEPEAATAKLGQEWRLASVFGIKKYPCCYANHPALDALLGLLRQEDVPFGEIESVELEVARVPAFYHAEATNAFMGKFNYEYNLAAAIVDHQVVQGTFHEQTRARPEMREALSRVRVVERPEKFGKEHPRSANVTVTLKSGKVLSRSVSTVYGFADEPLPDEDVVAKFRTNAARVLADRDVDALLGLLTNFDSAPLTAIMNLARVPALAQV